MAIPRCSLCPRSCRVPRADDAPSAGVCGMPAMPVVARAALHVGEEPCISGTRGSGTVFFSGCSLGCVFCQNHPISHERFGETVSIRRLAEIFWELEAQGAHNINLVNPTHYAAAIRQALRLYRPAIPVVYNSSGYERVETLRALEGLVDIYLPDLKYVHEEPAAAFSGASDYFSRAAAAILEMARQTGPMVLNAQGVAVKGTMVRHLVLPGELENTRRVIDWVSETFHPGDVLFSLMSQYTPQPGATGKLSRKVTAAEYRSAAAYLRNCGIRDGYPQERASAQEEYTPEFDLSGL